MARPNWTTLGLSPVSFSESVCHFIAMFQFNFCEQMGHIIFFCMKLISCHGKPLYEQLPVEVIKVDHFWKKDVPVILDNDDNDDNEDDLPCPNPTDDDDFDTIVWTSISNAIENSFLKLMKSLSMRKRTVRTLHLNKVEVVVVEIRPRGRKVPRLSDVKQRRRKRNLREM